MGKPLAVELFCGCFGWSAGWLEMGGRAVGFDIEHLPHHGPVPAGADLVLQDVLTLHGAQFKNAAVILASPPCQNYSYLAMPWSRSKSPHSQKAKALRRKWETEGPDNRLFDACFRIQREACEAAGRYIPLIVENVRGAQPWVGRSKWNYGSFHLWGDVPALMPINLKQGVKRGGGRSWSNFGKPDYKPFGFNTENEKAMDGQKVPGFRFDGSGRSFQTAAVDSQKVPVYPDPRRNGGKASHLTCPSENADKLEDGLKIGGDWFSDPKSTCRKHGSRSSARKAASALIARIPLELSRHIARVYFPR